MQKVYKNIKKFKAQIKLQETIFAKNTFTQRDLDVISQGF